MAYVWNAFAVTTLSSGKPADHTPDQIARASLEQWSRTHRSVDKLRSKWTPARLRLFVWRMLALPAIASVPPGYAQPGAIPPPAEQQTADCSRPVFATDQLVCAAPDLREFDNRLAAALRTFDQQPTKWLEPQWQWFLRRSRCAFQANHAQCVRSAYVERLAVTRPLSPRAFLATAACDDPSVGQVTFEPDRIGVLDSRGSLLGIGMPAAKFSGWVPYLTFARKGRQLTGSTPSGSTLRCQLTFIR